VPDRPAEGAPEVLDVLVGTAGRESLEALENLGRGLLAVLLDPALDRRTLAQRPGLVVEFLADQGLCLSLPRSKVSAPPVGYCFLPMASASSALLMRERPLTPSFLARSYSSCLELPTASTPP
jgi:hypothetical protein